jgi:hypothetical protein
MSTEDHQLYGIHVFREMLHCQPTADAFLRSRIFLYPEDGGDTFLRNVASYTTHTASVTGVETSNPTMVSAE